jgi:iron complex transport system permease protein
MHVLNRGKYGLVLSGFFIFVAAALVLSLMIGSERADLSKAVSDLLYDRSSAASMDEYIIFHLRLPRLIMAFLAGSALAVVGAVFQALLRNPLATPYTLGVSTGGSFGAYLALSLPSFFPAVNFHWGPVSPVPVFAFLGALLAVGIIYMLAQSGGRISPIELLLAGVVMGAIFSSLIMVVRYFSRPEELVNMDRWTMGMIDITGYDSKIWTAVIMLIPALVILLAQARALDQISFGESLAAGRGVNVPRLQKTCFLIGSLATAAVVGVVGPIGFVGLIVPHTVRRLVGPDHRLLLPCSILGGGGFLIACDTFARTIIAPTQLPVGIITALLGGPFFLVLLVRSRRSGGRVWPGS